MAFLVCVNKISDTKNSMDGFNSRLDRAKKKKNKKQLSDLGYRSIENIQTKAWRAKSVKNAEKTS